MPSDTEARWKHVGVHVVTGDRLDANTAQAPEGLPRVDPTRPDPPRA